MRIISTVLPLALLALLPLQMAADKPTDKPADKPVVKNSKDPSAYWDPQAEEQKQKTGKYLITCPGMPMTLWNAVAPPLGGKVLNPQADPLMFRVGADKEGDPQKAYPNEVVGFTVYAPKVIEPGEQLGLIVYIAPGQAALDGFMGHPFEQYAESRRYVLVSVNKAGNPDAVPWRAVCAVAASELARRRYNIQPERTYITGISGGGRLISYVMLRHSDIFCGAMPIVGINPPDMWASSTGIPGPSMKLFYQNSRLAILEGGKDFNRDQSKQVYDSIKGKMAMATYIEDPDCGHGTPKAGFLDQALDFMDGPLLAAGAQAWAKIKGKTKDVKKKGECLATLRPFAGVMYNKDWGGDAKAAFDTLNKEYAADLQKAESAIAGDDAKAAQKAINDLTTAWGLAAKEDGIRLKKELANKPKRTSVK